MSGWSQLTRRASGRRGTGGGRPRSRPRSTRGTAGPRPVGRQAPPAGGRCGRPRPAPRPTPASAPRAWCARRRGAPGSPRARSDLTRLTPGSTTRPEQRRREVAAQRQAVPGLIVLVDVEEDTVGHRRRSPAVLVDPAPDADPRRRDIPTVAESGARPAPPPGARPPPVGTPSRTATPRRSGARSARSCPPPPRTQPSGRATTPQQEERRRPRPGRPRSHAPRSWNQYGTRHGRPPPGHPGRSRPSLSPGPGTPSRPGSRPSIPATSPDGEVLVGVAWSAVNYKDAMVTRPGNRVARTSPLVPGVDLVGRVVDSSDPAVAAGQRGDRPRVRPRGRPARRVCRLRPGPVRMGGAAARGAHRATGGGPRDGRVHRRPLPAPTRAPRTAGRRRSGAGHRRLGRGRGNGRGPGLQPAATRSWPAPVGPRSTSTSSAWGRRGHRPRRPPRPLRAHPRAGALGRRDRLCGGPDPRRRAPLLAVRRRGGGQWADRREHRRDVGVPLHRPQRRPARRRHRPHADRRTPCGLGGDGHGRSRRTWSTRWRQGRWTSTASRRCSGRSSHGRVRGRMLVRAGLAASRRQRAGRLTRREPSRGGPARPPASHGHRVPTWPAPSGDRRRPEGSPRARSRWDRRFRHRPGHRSSRC